MGACGGSAGGGGGGATADGGAHPDAAGGGTGSSGSSSGSSASSSGSSGGSTGSSGADGGSSGEAGADGGGHDGSPGGEGGAAACTFVSTKDMCKTCGSDADCTAGNYCISDGQGGGEFFCAPDCTHGDCPVGDICAYGAIDVNNTTAVNVCYPASGTCGKTTTASTTDLCKPCTLDSQCGGGSCVYDGLTTGSYCAQSCIGTSCPKGDICVVVDDADPGAGSFRPTVCYPQSGTCTHPDAGKPPPATGCQGACASDTDCGAGERCMVTAEAVGTTNVTKSQCMPTCTEGGSCPEPGVRCVSGMDVDTTPYYVCAPSWACCL